MARYSFVGTDPYLVLTGRGGFYEMRRGESRTLIAGDAWDVLLTTMRAARVPKPNGYPPFFGGAVGWISYNLARRFERIPQRSPDDLGMPDLEFLFVDQVAALDHLTGTVHLLFSPPRSRFLSEPRDKLYREGCDRLAEWEARLSVRRREDEEARDATPSFRFAMTPEQSPAAYHNRVRDCQEFIRAGDIYQANISHRFSIHGDWLQTTGDRLAGELYRRLRRVNPSPFSALFQTPQWHLISASPERLIRLSQRRADTRPIAGTRRRGRDRIEDGQLVDDLLKDTKERAEHLMLVDLERNDLGRVCRYGTVQTTELMRIERYSHVSHIVSNVVGELRPDLDIFDLIPAMFPGGTITGVPKIRCMEIIETLEPVQRGPYTGSLGYISWNGDADFNILIRTVILLKHRGYLQVGAGIVADSQPVREYEETLLKAAAISKTLGAS